MLREVDLNKNLTKKEYKEMMDKLAPKFAALQREARAKGLPVMVIFILSRIWFRTGGRSGRRRRR